MRCAPPLGQKDDRQRMPSWPGPRAACRWRPAHRQFVRLVPHALRCRSSHQGRPAVSPIRPRNASVAGQPSCRGTRPQRILRHTGVSWPECAILCRRCGSSWSSCAPAFKIFFQRRLNSSGAAPTIGCSRSKRGRSSGCASGRRPRSRPQCREQDRESACIRWRR